MKPVVLRLYALLVVLALTGLIAWSGADWYENQQQAQTATQIMLRQAAGVVSDLTIRHQDLDNATLGKVFNRLGSDGRWKMLLLSSPDRGTEYYRGPRPAVPVDKAVPRWEAKMGSEVRTALPVFRTHGDPMVLEGIYEFYGKAEVFSLLKACGATLVLLLLLTSVMVFLASRGREEAAPESPQEPAQPHPEPQPRTPPRQEHHETESQPESDEYWFDENLTIDLPPMHAPEPAPAPVAEVPSTPRLRSESSLNAGLEHELQACTEQGQDLALVLLAVKEGSVRPDWQAVQKAFPSDLNFEWEGGAAVLLPRKSLEQALKAARTFVEGADATGTRIHAGVAARSGRRLSASTLLAEAASAKRRSLGGTVRVLGLKTDPDRYRDHAAAVGASPLL